MSRVDNHKDALAVIKKYGAEEGTGHLKGPDRAEAKAAKNWLRKNPPPARKAKTTKKK